MVITSNPTLGIEHLLRCRAPGKTKSAISVWELRCSRNQIACSVEKVKQTEVEKKEKSLEERYCEHWKPILLKKKFLRRFCQHNSC